MPRQKNLVGITPGGGITEDHLVGFYLWYSIRDEMVSISRVRRAAAAHELDDSRWPKARSAADVFMEACRRVEGRHTNGAIIEIRAEQVVQEGNEIVYQITKHVWDRENRVIEHPKALRVTFNKFNEKTKFERLDETDRHELKDLEERITEHFEKNRAKWPGHKMRTVLRHYLQDVGAENMRGDSGGVYFLPMQNPTRDGSTLRDVHGPVINGREFLEQTQAFLRDVYGRIEFHLVPCVNDEGQREYLKRKFIENCDDDLEQYREDVLDLVRSKDKRTRGFRRDLVANLIDRRRTIDERRQKFAGILQDELEELNRNMELADKALATFMKEADQQPVGTHA